MFWSECGGMRAKAEWRTDLKIFFSFFFPFFWCGGVGVGTWGASRSPKNKECELLSWDRLRGEKDVKGLELKSAAWSIQRVSELDQILCVLQRVSGSPVKLAQWHEFFGWAKKKISGYYNYCHLSFCLLFFRLTPYRAFCAQKTPLLSGFKKATIWSCAKYIQVSSQ